MAHVLQTAGVDPDDNEGRHRGGDDLISSTSDQHHHHQALREGPTGNSDDVPTLESSSCSYSSAGPPPPPLRMNRGGIVPPVGWWAVRMRQADVDLLGSLFGDHGDEEQRLALLMEYIELKVSRCDTHTRGSLKSLTPISPKQVKSHPG